MLQRVCYQVAEGQSLLWSGLPGGAAVLCPHAGLGGSPKWEKRGDERAGVCQGGCEDKSQPHLCEGPALTAQEKCLPGQMYSDTVLAWIFVINSPEGLFIQEFA